MIDTTKTPAQALEVDLKNWIIEKVKFACLDMGAKLDNPEMLHLCSGIYNTMIKGDRKNWMINEFSSLLDSGVKGYYDKKPSSKFTMVYWYAWLDQYSKHRASRYAKASMDQQQKDAYNTSGEMTNGTSLYSSVFFMAFNLRTAYGVKYNDTKGLKDLVHLYQEKGEFGLREYYKGLVSKKSPIPTEL